MGYTRAARKCARGITSAVVVRGQSTEPVTQANVSSPMEEPLGRQLSITGRVVRDRFDGCLGHYGSSLATWAVLRSADEEAGVRACACRKLVRSGGEVSARGRLWGQV